MYHRDIKIKALVTNDFILIRLTSIENLFIGNVKDILDKIGNLSNIQRYYIK